MTWAILVAAGRGTRLGGGVPKGRRLLGGRPLYLFALQTLLCHRAVAGVILVVPPGDEAGFASDDDRVRTVPGGEERRSSVLAGIRALPASDGDVLIHDAARPFLTPALLDRVLAPDAEAVVPGLPLTDTVKETGAAGLRTLERERLVRVQTPQRFRVSTIARAHREVAADVYAPDDAALVEALGVEVKLVAGDAGNVKLTTPVDWQLAEERLGELRVGTGLDIHPLVAGRPLILAGHIVASDRGPAGDSDGDPLTHALIDALLGATAQGDIGTLFPPGDPAYRGARSLELLAQTRLRLAGPVTVVNVDATIVLQSPRLGPHLAAIRARLAAALDVAPERVSVKAKTADHLGALGREEGIAAQVTLLLRVQAGTQAPQAPHR